MGFLYILLAILIFGALIFIHELGHFTVAKLCGVKILEFSIGMGPKLCSFRSKKSGTAYSLRLFPIGGYVSMFGESGMEPVQGKNTPENETEPREQAVDPFGSLSSDKADPFDDPEAAKHAYCNQSVWKRMLISVAGPAMNVLLGFLLMFILVGNMQLGTTVVADYQEENQSAAAGLMIGDEIIKVGSVRVHSLYQLNYEIMNQGYRPLDLTVLRNGEKVVIPGVTFFQTTEKGVTFGGMDFLVWEEPNRSFGTLARHSVWQTESAVKIVLDSLKDLIRGRYGMEAVSGPVGITKTISDAAKVDMLSVLHLVIIISINLGIMNLLPLPALDGGHLFLYVIELIRRKPIPQSVEGVINFAGLVILLALAALIAIKDVIAL